MADEVLVSTQHQVATITFNRPDKRNALTGHMVAMCAQALTTLANDPAIRVLVLAGQGDHFCAGMDIHWMKHIASATAEANYEDACALASLYYQLYFFPKPTVLLAQGATLGGGVGLAAACDMVLATHSASFGFPEVKIGMTPSTISPYVIAAIGERAARYYFLTGETLSAETASRLGLVHEVVADDQLQAAKEALISKLCQNSPYAMKVAKQLIYRMSNETISEALVRATAEHLADMRISPEAQEGLSAFLEKRMPGWRS